MYNNTKIAQELVNIANILAAEEKPERLDTKTKNAINEQLDEISTHNPHTYYVAKDVPFNKIMNILKKHGIVALDDEGHEWKGIFALGNSGHHNFDLGRDLGNKVGPAFNNTMLHMNWQSMGNPEKSFEFLVRLT